MSKRLELEADKDYVILADNMEVLPTLPDNCVDLIYIDPPFNTGKVQRRATTKAFRAPRTLTDPGFSSARSGSSHDLDEELSESNRGVRKGFQGASYRLEVVDEMWYRDAYDDYIAFLAPRLEQAKRLLSEEGSIYVHLDYREVHYVKVELDRIFGRKAFLNEIV